MPAMMCPKCNYLIVDSSKPCPSCGAAIPALAVPPSPVASRSYREQVQYDDDNSQRFSIKTIAVILCVVIIILAGGGGFYYYKKQERARLEAERIEQARLANIEQERIAAEHAEKAKFNEYVDSIIEASKLMLDGSIKSEEMTNMIARIWYNAIHEERNYYTDKYVRKTDEEFRRSPGYSLYHDFNTALRKYYQDRETQTNVREIESNQESVMEVMRNLQNPPDGCQNAYDTLSEMYKAYNTLTEMAINPSGSLQTYSNTKNTVVSEFANINKQLSTRIPVKKTLE